MTLKTLSCLEWILTHCRVKERWCGVPVSAGSAVWNNWDAPSTLSYYGVTWRVAVICFVSHWHEHTPQRARLASAWLWRYASGGELFDYIVGKGRVPELEAPGILHTGPPQVLKSLTLIAATKSLCVPGMPLLPSDYCRLGEGEFLYRPLGDPQSTTATSACRTSCLGSRRGMYCIKCISLEPHLLASVCNCFLSSLWVCRGSCHEHRAPGLKVTTFALASFLCTIANPSINWIFVTDLSCSLRSRVCWKCFVGPRIFSSMSTRISRLLTSAWATFSGNVNCCVLYRIIRKYASARTDTEQQSSRHFHEHIRKRKGGVDALGRWVYLIFMHPYGYRCRYTDMHYLV